ncbi:MAG TPA: hypothetical protein VN520_16240 [Streptomyces sp.]|uniref:hypothetical protein n=1 Tax=Streptomyces sp. TaxID=1931 RepID=UPI002BB9241B|nr:hypothetical protein [Streptomyces sp.]HWU07906.1 hypothetical protein [Streptomyces sp.]
MRGCDTVRWAPYAERCRASGVRLTTFAQPGESPSHRRRLYELDKECAAGTPGRGPFHSFEEYVHERLAAPSFDPRGAVLALADEEWTGMAATTDHRERGCAFNEMAGVRHEHRRSG